MKINRELTNLEQSYLIDTRAIKLVNEHGTIPETIKYLKAELNEFDELWSMYSGDGLGHAITHNRLMINYLEEILNTNG